MLTDLATNNHLQLPASAETLGLALFSLVLGLGMQRAANPSISTEVVAVIFEILTTGQAAGTDRAD
ncbi:MULTISPECIES: hypothetical protein [unclassified Nocardia]|uniref:hypothetical protein n=1 Tax=unclassified Nocardia TaxID=2637762 RepID=UPI0033B37477